MPCIRYILSLASLFGDGLCTSKFYSVGQYWFEVGTIQKEEEEDEDEEEEQQQQDEEESKACLLYTSRCV